MSTSTGPGRPWVATWNAWWMVSASFAGSLTSQLCLVQGRVMPTVSASWKASLPIRKVGDLAGQDDDRDRVHQRVGHAGDGVGGAGAGGDEHDAGPAGRARVALGGVRGALLVAHQDVADVVLLEDLVVDRQHRAAGIAEHGVDALVLQGLDDDLARRSSVGSSSSSPSVCRPAPARPPQKNPRSGGHGACPGRVAQDPDRSPRLAPMPTSRSSSQSSCGSPCIRQGARPASTG